MVFAVALPSRVWAVMALLRVVGAWRGRAWGPAPVCRAPRRGSVLLQLGVQRGLRGQRLGAGAQRGEVGAAGQRERDDVGDLGELRRASPPACASAPRRWPPAAG